MNSSTYKRALWLTTGAAMAAAAVPVSAEVYLSESQAIGAILGDKAIVRREHKILDPAMRKKLEQSSSLQFPENEYTFFIATQDGKPAKYAIALNEVGKTEPITFMVGMSPEGKVSEVVIMEFRENRGWEVKEKRFLNQFRGKTGHSAIRVDEDIINYAGATLSSKAITRGVKRALLLLDAFYPGDTRYKLSAARDFAQPGAMAPLATLATLRGTIQLHRQIRYAMGTYCEIRAWCHSADDARGFFTAGFGELERIEQIFSAYRHDSELNRVNRNAGNATVEVSEDFAVLAAESLRHTRRTNGLADITVGSLLKAWGVGAGEGHHPDTVEIVGALQYVGVEKVALDAKKRTIRFSQTGVQLDFGGFAKGYAAQKIARKMEDAGASSALVSLGRSSLFASRVRSEFASQDSTDSSETRCDQWPVAIAHPDGRTAPPLWFFLNANQALSTSGTSERKLETDGKIFSHIIHPKTGMPLEGIRAATVVAKSGVAAEAASKELLLLDPAHRKEWLSNRGGDDWVHFEVDRNGELIENSSQSG